MGPPRDRACPPATYPLAAFLQALLSLLFVMLVCAGHSVPGSCPHGTGRGLTRWPTEHRGLLRLGPMTACYSSCQSIQRVSVLCWFLSPNSPGVPSSGNPSVLQGGVTVVTLGRQPGCPLSQGRMPCARVRHRGQLAPCSGFEPSCQRPRRTVSQRTTD